MRTEMKKARRPKESTLFALRERAGEGGARGRNHGDVAFFGPLTRWSHRLFPFRSEDRPQRTDEPRPITPDFHAGDKGTTSKPFNSSIAVHCQIRGWHLHAVHARTKHVHVVVTAPGRNPEDVMDQFKVWCTRKLKERERLLGAAGNCVRRNWWTQRGSKRWINNNDDLCAANQYVVEEQGEPTPRTQA
jgi:hypothetical protein